MAINPTRHPTATAAALTGLVLFALPLAASASSFQILEQSPARLGTAFAGTASIANDATTAYFNPAGMARLDSREISIGMNRIGVSSKFDNDGSTNAAGAPLAGDEDKTDKPGYVPNFYLVQPLSKSATVGFGINAPFGLESKYDDDWQGRYLATHSELKTINYNLSLAFAVTDTFSFGVGVDYQKTDATLKNEVDSFGACVGGGGPAATCAALEGGPGNRASDSSVKLDADDSAVVMDLSLHWQPSKATAIGVVWRQGADFTLTGNADFSQSASCQADPYCGGALSALDGNAAADVAYPDTITASISHAFTDAWSLHADIAWTGWSTLNKIRIKNTDNGQTINTLDLEYDDTMRYALGATYRTGSWTWRAGVAYDEAPQTDPQHVSPRIPDQDRTWIATGFRYTFSHAASVDVGYAHLFVDDAHIDKSDSTGNNLKGSFDASVDTLAVQANWRF